MIRAIIRIGIDQIVEIGELHSVIDFSMDRIMEEDHHMLIPIEMILEETVLEECRIIELRILEVDIEVIIETSTLEEVEVGLEKENIKVILEGMTEAVSVGLAQVCEPVLIEIGLDDLNVGNMIILLRIVQFTNRKKPRTNIKMYYLDKDQTAIKVSAADTYHNLIRTNSDDATVDHLNL